MYYHVHITIIGWLTKNSIWSMRVVLQEVRKYAGRCKWCDEDVLLKMEAEIVLNPYVVNLR